MLTEKQVRELEQSTPRSLRNPDQGEEGEDPRVATLRWVAAEGGDTSGVTFDTLAQPGCADNERLSAHVAFSALQILAIAERQATRQLPPEEDLDASSVAPLHPALLQATQLRHSSRRIDRTTAAEQLEISEEMAKIREERDAAAAVVEQKDSELWARYRELKTLQFRLVDPGVATGYFHDRRVPMATRRANALIYYLHDIRKLPLLLCIAIVGGLRNGTVPVDIDHPDREEVFERYEKGLKRYRERIRRSQGPHRFGVYLSPGPGGKPCSPLLANGPTRPRNKS